MRPIYIFIIVTLVFVPIILIGLYFVLYPSKWRSFLFKIGLSKKENVLQEEQHIIDEYNNDDFHQSIRRLEERQEQLYTFLYSQSGQLDDLMFNIDELKKTVNRMSYDISQRFETIEYYVKDVKPYKEEDQDGAKITESQGNEISGYFGFPISRTYLKFQKNKSEDSYFRAMLNNNNGYFELISLEKLKSEEGLDCVIRFQGSVRKADARDYAIISKGTVRKIEDGLWKIEQPLVVELN